MMEVDVFKIYVDRARSYQRFFFNESFGGVFRRS